MTYDTIWKEAWKVPISFHEHCDDLNVAVFSDVYFDFAVDDFCHFAIKISRMTRSQALTIRFWWRTARMSFLRWICILVMWRKKNTCVWNFFISYLKIWAIFPFLGISLLPRQLLLCLLQSVLLDSKQEILAGNISRKYFLDSKQ